MNSQPDFARFRRALLCQGEGDRVPLAELGIEMYVKQAFLGRPIRSLADEVEFWARAGYDFVPLDHGLHSLLERSSTLRGSGSLLLDPHHKIVDVLRKSGRAIQETYELYEDSAHERVWQPEGRGLIGNQEEFESFPWVTADDFDYSKFEEAASALPQRMKIVAVLGYIYTAVWQLMGFETFCGSLVEDPDLVAKLFDKTGSIQYEVLERITRSDAVGAVCHPDDIAYCEGPMISPKYLRHYLFPWVKRCAALCKERGLPFIYHSDGNLCQVLDDLVNCGVNALHPIEPKAMDIVGLKQRYGGKLCLIGNIDLSYTLTLGTPREVEEEVKERLRQVAGGGGYCLGSSNSIPGYVPLANYLAMREAGLRYGWYPITIPGGPS